MDFNFDDIFTGFDIDPVTIGFDFNTNISEVNEKACEELSRIKDVDSKEIHIILEEDKVVLVDMENVFIKKQSTYDISCRLGCGKFFCARTSESDHYKTHHLGLTFKCQICTSAFGSKRSLTRHISSLHFNHHLLRRTERYGCMKCTLTFGTKQGLGFHHEDVHTKKVFVCGIDGCRKYYQSRRKRAYHVRSCHEGDHSCSMCDKTYSMKFNLDKHIRSKHINVE